MKIAYIFPGQGAQAVGMGKAFYDCFSEAKHVFEEADDLLKIKLSSIIFQGPEGELKLTKNSQPALFITSIAILQVLRQHFNLPSPIATGGLSLGEYTALVAAGKITFQEGLQLVQKRARFMHEACEKTQGTMAVVLGLQDQIVREVVTSLDLPNDLWCANFNCPGQVVISGTLQGIEAAKAPLLKQGAKRVLPLEVHGAFHSGLMMPAQEELKKAIDSATFINTSIPIAMNVTGKCEVQSSVIKPLLVEQLTKSVLWSRCIQSLDQLELDCFLEVGSGTTLQGLNKRIAPKAATFSIEKPDQIDLFLKNFSI